MAVYPVIVTNTPPASVTITGANTTYTEFKNSLGTFFYLIETIYLYSLTGQQINQVMLYTKYDGNGNRIYLNMTPTLDPWQDSNAYYLDTKGEKIILDGLSRLSFMMLASASLMFKIYAKRISNTEQLDSLSQSNFQVVESAMGKVDLFKGFIGYKPKKELEEVTLYITNNTTANIPVNLFANPDDNENINAVTMYKWDMLAFSFASTGLIIPYRASDNPVFTNYTFTGPLFSLQAIINALNALGTSIFYELQIGPNTYIATNTENYVYGNITLSP
jgi:hypothetical protein